MASLGDDLRAWTQSILTTLELHLRAAGFAQPEVEAAVLFALIDGVSQHYAIDPDRYPLEAVAEAVVAHYCR